MNTDVLQIITGTSDPSSRSWSPLDTHPGTRSLHTVLEAMLSMTPLHHRYGWSITKISTSAILKGEHSWKTTVVKTDKRQRLTLPHKQTREKLCFWREQRTSWLFLALLEEGGSSWLILAHLEVSSTPLRPSWAEGAASRDNFLQDRPFAGVGGRPSCAGFCRLSMDPARSPASESNW